MAIRQQKKRSALELEQLEARQLLTADIVSFSPANLSTFVDGAADLRLEFSDAVKAASGSIVIKNADDGSVLETIDVQDTTRVTMDGNAAIVNPASDLPVRTNISVTVEDGAFQSTKTAVFEEDFEGVELFPLESSTEGGGDGTDWTDVFPDGWERDNTDTPEGEPFEFYGFTIFDKASWVTTAGGQGRELFTIADGNVVVADGDEYDDGTDIDPDLFNVFLTTPEVSLAGQAADSVELQFDSSFRPYPTMVGTVDVSFDGGSNWDNLLTLDDTTVEGGTSSLTRVNNKEILDLSNPADASVMIRFGMTDAGNDWWWAIDNVALVAASDDGTPVDGITDDSTWTFETSPLFNPANGATAVAVDTNLTVTFEADVHLTPGDGNVEIRRAADDSVVEILPVASERVTANGPTVTIDPAADLEANTEYYVLIDEFSIFDTAPVESPGITIFAEDFEGLPLQDSGLVGGNDTDNYLVVMEGVLDVQVAGEYTFGGNSDDGQLLAIDLDGDGDLDPFGDAIIFDDATHGTEDRLSTCDFGLTSCVGEGVQFFSELENLAVGQYAFEYWYFENTGGSGGEFFYAPGFHEEFSADSFAIVGDDSKGIGVTAAGITATTYLADVQDETLDTITSLDRAEELLLGFIPSVEGFPVSAQVEFADVYDSGGSGRYFHNNPVPGIEPPEAGDDWSPESPEGWTRESTVEDLGTPEYNGWTFLNKEFWIAEQGGQDRDTFEKGQNVMAVSDPDAIDDYVDIGGDGQDEEGIYDGWLATPVLPLDNVNSDNVFLVFDSSFRPYPTMKGSVEVSFDEGGSWENLLTLDENTVEGGVSSLARANATESIEVDVTNESSVMFRWLMEDAGNDWWWAVDNIRVTTPITGNPLPGIDASDVWRFTTGDGSGGEILDGDLDGNGSVDFADFLALAGSFGSNVDPAGSGADIDGDGTVGFGDFLLLAGNFGKSISAIAADVSHALQADTVDSFATDGANSADDENDTDLFAAL